MTGQTIVHFMQPVLIQTSPPSEQSGAKLRLYVLCLVKPPGVGLVKMWNFILFSYGSANKGNNLLFLAADSLL